MEISFSEKERQRHALMEAIFREHYVEIHAFVLHKVRRPEIADDLTSVVFLKALRWLLEDRGIRQVRSWLYAAAHTTLADYGVSVSKGEKCTLSLQSGEAAGKLTEGWTDFASKGGKLI